MNNLHTPNAKKNNFENSVEKFFTEQNSKDLLRFITCGSVDDGKSTLIGRLLYETKMVFEDQLLTLKSDSKKFGTQGEMIDFALLVDGLAAEREQGITIDVAYRYFSTKKRKYIVADTPGHEQYTRNMITGASTANLAIVLVDATKGMLTQTKRHTFLVSLVGIKQILLAVNKMDMVGYQQKIFDEIASQYISFAQKIGIKNITPIPLSALHGDNIVEPSSDMSWYAGPSLMDALDHATIENETAINQPFRFPVQWVNRPNSNFRGFAGTIASGSINQGDTICSLPSGQIAKVSSILLKDHEQHMAQAGQAITITLDREIDISRGNVISQSNNRPAVADQFETTIVWMSDEPLYPGRSYSLKLSTQTTSCSITKIKYLINVNTLGHSPATQLGLNSVSVCQLTTDKPIVFESFKDNANLGSFILIDRISNQTVGAGTIHFSLMRSQNSHQQFFEIGQNLRTKITHQKPLCIWFTGLSGSGKSTIANALEKKLFESGKLTYILDGDNIRHGLNKDLGFSHADRIENIRRVSEVAKLMIDAGLIVLVTFISPFKADRDLARSKFDDNQFIEIFIDTPIEECEKRDPKGLYKKVRGGLLKNFTGIDSPYEKPVNPDITIQTNKIDLKNSLDLILLKINSYPPQS